MLKELIKIANELDSRGLLNEADAVDHILIKIAGGRTDFFGDLLGGLVRSGDEALDMERASARYSNIAGDAARVERVTEDIARAASSTGTAMGDVFVGGSAGARSFLDYIQEIYKRLGQDMSLAQQRAFLEEQVRASPYVEEAAKADPNSVVKALAGEASAMARAPLSGPVTRLEIKDIISRPHSGEGGGGKFWAIPNSDLGIKVSKRIIPKIDEYLNKNTFESADEVTGELVGTIGRDIWILKRKKGFSGGAPYRGGGVYSEADIAGYKSNIILEASLPQSAYDDAIRELVDFNNRGIMIDPSKGSNLLVDIQNNKINFVDLDPMHPGGGYANRGHDLLVMLVEPYAFRKMNLHNDLEAVEAGRVIQDKVRRAVANNGNIEPGHGGLDIEFVFRPDAPPSAPSTPIKSSPWDDDVW